MAKIKYLSEGGKYETFEIDDAELKEHPHLEKLLKRFSSAADEPYERSFDKSPSFEKEHDKTPSHGNSFGKS